METNRHILDLDSQDITLIEHAIRDEIDALVYENFTLSAENAPANCRKIHALEELLGKLHSSRPERRSTNLGLSLG
ncbi:MAG TPA: hypothetical protein VNL74_08505 [Methylococcus sp.]|nr:hypothetical protein [Methylococcus sp.]